MFQKCSEGLTVMAHRFYGFAQAHHRGQYRGGALLFQLESRVLKDLRVRYFHQSSLQYWFCLRALLRALHLQQREVLTPGHP